MKKIIVILGSGRSGTTLLTRIMHAMGMALPSQLIESGDNNRQGGWEDSRISDISNALLRKLHRPMRIAYLPLPPGWQNTPEALEAQRQLTEVIKEETSSAIRMWGFKEPAAAQLLPLWQHIFDSLEIKPVYLLATRHPVSTALSREALFGIPREVGELIWLGREAMALKHTDAKLCVVHFEKWFMDPYAQARTILEYTGLPWHGDESDMKAAVDSVIDPTLNRCAAEAQKSREPLCTELHEILWRAEGGIPEATTALDVVERYLKKMEQDLPYVLSLEGLYLEAEEQLARRKEYKEIIARLRGREERLTVSLAESREQKDTLREKNKKLREINKELREGNNKLQEADKELRQQIATLDKTNQGLRETVHNIKASFSFRLGKHCTDAVAEPGRKTLLLPYHLLKLVFEAASGGIPEGSKAPAPRSQEKPLPAKRTQPDKVEQFSGPCDYNDHLKGQQEHLDQRFKPSTLPRQGRLSDQSIACLTSGRLLANLQPDLDARGITPETWVTLFEDGEPEFLLVESDIGQLSRAWGLSAGGEIAEASPLAELLDHCRQTNIPVVFWHTEPAEHAPYYTGLARRADLLCSVESSSREFLTRSTGRGDTLLLPWAVQPAHHNPTFEGLPEPAYRTQTILLDGWADFLENLGKFEAYRPLLASGLEIVDSRWKFKKNKLRDSPDFADAIKGCLNEEQLRTALKYYKISLFTEHTLKSSSTLTRLMLESAAAKALPFFHGWQDGLSDSPLLASVCQSIPDAKQLNDTIEALLADADDLQRTAHLAWRKVHTNETYAHRLRSIFEHIGKPFAWEEFPLLSSVTITKRPHFLARAKENYLKQAYPNKEWVVILNSSSISLDEAKRLLDGCPCTRVMQMHEDYNIGACLNYAISQTRGAFWFKMDDDDFYGEHYLSDMMLAQKSTGADLFGKRAAFAYFEAEDAVYERGNPYAVDMIALNQNAHLCGATFAGKKKLLEKTSFSEDFRACVDSTFFSDCLNSGQRVQFTDIYNMVVYRSADMNHHTWRLSSSSLQDKATFISKGQDFESIIF